MTKGADTRERVVSKAAELFSTHGYFGSSMSDLLRLVGLQKGGFYNHFGSKEELALAAFDHAVGRIAARCQAALVGKEHAVDRLLAVVDVFRSLVDDPLLAGGCPILNTAVETDDTFPPLRDRARQAMDDWQRLIGWNVKRGVAAGQLRPGTDPRQLATVVTATLEGAVMLSKLYGDPGHMHRAADHVADHIRSLATAPVSTAKSVR